MDRTGKILPLMERTAALLVVNPVNMVYVSGFTGEGGVLIGEGLKAILTDSRYTEQAGQQAPGFDVFKTTADQSQNQWVQRLLQEKGIQRLMTETDFLSYDAYMHLAESLPGVQLEKNTVDFLKIRSVKDPEEIAATRRAAQITDLAFEFLCNRVREGMTERNLVALLYQFFLDHGAEGFSFSPIIASGENSSLPHAVA